jgi:hypothetical protein
MPEPTNAETVWDIRTGASGYTHVICGRCGHLAYCSEAEPWEPQQEYGWCPHDPEGPEATGTTWPTDADLHNCLGGMRPLGAHIGRDANE